MVHDQLLPSKSINWHIFTLLCVTVLHVVVCHDHVPGEHLGLLADALTGSGGYLAGSGQMVAQSLAAGMAVNMQWFQPATATGIFNSSLTLWLFLDAVASLEPGM